MNKIVRRVFLASVLLLLIAGGSCYVGDLQSQNEQRQSEKYEEAIGIKIYDGDLDTTNYWQVSGFLLFFGSFAVGMAGGMLWRQTKNTNR